MGPKIATCSYCGTRAALVFDQGLHELACRACGAPLHDMKMMPQASERKEKQKKSKPKKHSPRRDQPAASGRSEWRDWPAKKRRKKKRKPVLGRVFEEVWDVVEDIFD